MSRSIGFWGLLCTLICGAASAADLRPLREALTLHASFDESLNADFSRGSKDCLVSQRGELVSAQTNDEVRIAAEGRYGQALHFTRKGSYRPLFSGQNVLGYNDRNWGTTVSVWLRLNPDRDLEPGYCDPVQIVGDDSKKGFIFLEWSKDETPRFFRYAIRPLFPIWNPKNVKWDEIPADQRPMVQVSRAPFAADKWTHVVFTVENANASSQPQRGRLFLNGQPAGAIENWELTFGWKPEQVQVVLGAAYVGFMDDLSVFNRPLKEEDVQQLYSLEHGVQDLYR